MSRRLLLRVEAFLVEAAMPMTVFGRGAVNDPRLVRDMRDGRDIGDDMAKRIEAFMQRWRDDREAGEVQQVGDRRRNPTMTAQQLADEALRSASDDSAAAVELLLTAAEIVEKRTVQGN